MNKKDAVELLGGPDRLATVAADNLRIGKSAFSLWPEKLNHSQKLRVIGAAWVQKKKIPERFRDEECI